jgi:hypothetical protein
VPLLPRCRAWWNGCGVRHHAAPAGFGNARVNHVLKDVRIDEFPDAYIDPYPESFAALARFADHGVSLVDELPSLGASPLGMQVASYFAHLSSTAQRLRGMAEKQRAGTEFSADDLAFMNGIVADSAGCYFDPRGWFAQLVFGHEDTRGTEFDPTIADVHTQPADAGGAIVGRVLHAGTGPARLLVVTVVTCTGPRAYGRAVDDGSRAALSSRCSLARVERDQKRPKRMAAPKISVGRKL